MEKESKKNINNSATIKRTHWIYSGVLFLIFFFSYQYIFDKKLDLGGDNAGYYILGKALSSGEGYTNIHFPDNPAHNHFPPGYPVIIALFMLVSNSIIFIKIVNGVFLLGSALMMYKMLYKVSQNTKLAFVTSALMLLNMHLLYYSRIMMSEIPFLFFATWSLLLFMNVSEKEKFWKSPSFYGLLLISSFAFHIRTAGIALAGGFILYLLLKKRWAFVGSYIVGFVALAIPWILRGKSLGGSPYLEQLLRINPYRPEQGNMEIGDWFTRFFNNLTRYISKEIPHGIFPGLEVNYAPDATEALWFSGIVCVALIVFGLYKLKNYKLLFIGYILGTFGILLLWPDVWFSVRFMLPLIPVFLFLILFAVYELLNLIAEKMSIKKEVSPLLMLILAFFFLPQLKDLKVKADKPYPSKYNNYFEIGNWANKNVPQDAVISTRKPTLFYLFANRKLSSFKSTHDYNEFNDGLNDKNVTHVVIDQLGFSQTSRYLVPFVQANPEKFNNLFTLPNPDTYLLTYNKLAGYDGEWKQTTQENGMVTSVRHGKGVLKDNRGNIIKEGNWIDGQYQNPIQTQVND